MGYIILQKKFLIQTVNLPDRPQQKKENPQELKDESRK
jgi:hypothetical protein